MIAVKKILGIGLISVTALSLSGCGLTPLPDEERYSRINQVKNFIDLESAGSIIKEDYSGDGVWSGSSYTVELEGVNSFDNLKDQLEKFVGAKGCSTGETQFSCTTNHNPTIRLYKEGTKSTLTLTDSLGGRDEK